MKEKNRNSQREYRRTRIIGRKITQFRLYRSEGLIETSIQRSIRLGDAIRKKAAESNYHGRYIELQTRAGLLETLERTEIRLAKQQIRTANLRSNYSEERKLIEKQYKNRHIRNRVTGRKTTRYRFYRSEGHVEASFKRHPCRPPPCFREGWKWEHSLTKLPRIPLKSKKSRRLARLFTRRDLRRWILVDNQAANMSTI